MSLGHGTSMVRSGLVFHYDMSNTAKSWKGMPTTNLITNPKPINTTGYTAAGGAGSVTYVDESVYWVRTSYDVWGAYFTFDPFFNGTLDTGAVYTISFMWKSLSDFSSSLFHYNLVQGNGVSVAASANNITLYSTYVVDGWYQFKYSFTPVNAGVGNAYNRLQVSQVSPSALVTRMYIKNVQFEKSPFITPFINGTRSNTQAIVDLTKNYTITATSLSYAADNTFSFNGTSSVLTSPLPQQLLSTGFSVSVIFNYNQTTTNDNLISWGSGAFNGTTYAWEIRIRGGSGTNVEFSPGVGPGGTGTPNRLSYNQGTNPLNGRIAIIDVTMLANGVASIYENGVLKNSLSYSGIGLYTTTNNLAIGHGSDTFFPGDIYSTKIYNRALSAAEVSQNFEAVRGRYGI